MQALGRTLFTTARALVDALAEMVYPQHPVRIARPAPEWLNQLVGGLAVEAGITFPVHAKVYRSPMPQALACHAFDPAFVLFSDKLVNRAPRRVLRGISAHEVCHMLPSNPSRRPRKSGFETLVWACGLVLLLWGLAVSLAGPAKAPVYVALGLTGLAAMIAASRRRTLEERRLELRVNVAASKVVGDDLIEAMEWTYSPSSLRFFWPLHRLMTVPPFSLLNTHPAPSEIERAIASAR